MADKTKDIDIAQFLGLEPCDIKIDTKEFAILIGNGLGKSHPEHGHAFNFDPDYVFRRFLGEMNTQYYDPKLMGLKEELQSSFTDPEHFFQAFRMEMITIILGRYIEQVSAKNLSSKGLAQFLEKFQAVFTLNYDSLLNINAEKARFDDGLNPEVIKQCSKIKEGMKRGVEEENKIPIYYMHGAFNIFEHVIDVGCRGYVKIIDETMKEDLERAKNELYKMLHAHRKDELKVGPHITCVLSSHDIFKEDWIRVTPYLSFCMEQFKESKKLLIFGCSFENDQHILRAIKDSRIEELYVCYKDEKHRENLEKLFRSNNLYEKKAILGISKIKIQYINSKHIAEIIWPQP